MLAAGELGSKGLSKETGASSHAKDATHPYVVIENEGIQQWAKSLK